MSVARCNWRGGRGRWAGWVLAAGLIGLVGPAWAQPGTPDIRGNYQGTGSVTLTNCIIKQFNTTAGLTATIDLTNQTGQSFTTDVNASLTFPFPVTVTDTTTLTGTVTPDGQLSGTFTMLIHVSSPPVTLPGSGTFTGQANGDNLTVNITGKVTQGETCNLTGTINAVRADTSLASAVLPGSRSVQVGNTATAYALIVNAGATQGLSCKIRPITNVPANFTFQTTNPATNQVTGTPNTPADIASGGFQTFVIAFTPTGPFGPTDVQLSFECANAASAGVIPGVNTLLLSASTSPVPDIVALAGTIKNDGIVDIPGTSGTGFFVVATVNVGASASITATVDTGTASLPLQAALCQTDPATGQCIGAVGPSVAMQINANQTPTVAVFVTGAGTVPFDPAGNRIFVRFKDSGGVTRGATSVAVRTSP